MSQSHLPPRLSLILPVYNEERHLETQVERIHRAGLPAPWEIVAVDDASTDRSREILLRLLQEGRIHRLLFHTENRGKGAAVRTGIPECQGEIIGIQDADLEYDPADWARLLDEIQRTGADAAFGSRAMSDNQHFNRVYRWGNAFLTWVSNLFTGLRLTDMETCLKAIRGPLFQALTLRQDGFGIEPEITVQLARKGARIVEVPIQYTPRTRAEGKKIHWTDGVEALYLLARLSWESRRTSTTRQPEGIRCQTSVRERPDAPRSRTR